MGKFAAGVGVLLALSLVQPASAQVSLGFRGGASISDFSLESDEVAPDLDSSTGLLLGAFVDVPLATNLSFQPGLQYVQKGAEVSAVEDGMEVSLGIDLAYLEIPLLLRYAFPTDGPVGVHLFAGPALGFEASCEVGVEGGGFRASFDCDQGEEVDFAFDTKSLDVGALFGGGLSFEAGPGALLVEGSYNLGLTNLAEDADEGESVKNRAFYVTAGYTFPIN